MHPPPHVHSRACYLQLEVKLKRASVGPTYSPRMSFLPASVVPLEHSGFFWNRVATSPSVLQLGMDDVQTLCKADS